MGLEFFTIALKDAPFKLVYIDTFAGSSKFTINSGRDVRHDEGLRRLR